MVLTPRVGAPLISEIPSRWGKEEEPLPRWTEDGEYREVVYHGTTCEALLTIFARDLEESQVIEAVEWHPAASGQTWSSAGWATACPSCRVPFSPPSSASRDSGGLLGQSLAYR